MLMITVELFKNFKKEIMSFSFELNSNKVVIFGPSGCGKTTLLKLIAGLYRPDNGLIAFNDKVFYCKKDSIDVPVHLRNIGYMPQEYSLFPNMSVRENILYGLKARGIKLDKTNFKKLVQRLQIENKLEEYPATLSGGQKQRAALARILIIKPSLILLDEPFGALDAPIRDCLRDLVSDISEEENITVLFVTHSIEDLHAMAEEVVIIDAGEIKEYGKVSCIVDEPCFTGTARVLGYKNIMEIERVDGNKYVLKNGLVLCCNARKAADAGYICVKAEKIKILKCEAKESKDFLNRFDGIIERIHCRGNCVRIVFQTDFGHKLEINVPENCLEKSNLVRGERMTAVIDETSMIFCR